MTVEQIEDIAMIANAKMPNDLSEQEKVLFLKFRYLHSVYRVGGISREQASIEKQRFLVEHRKAVSHEKFRLKQSLHTVAMWKEMERIVIAYQKDRTLENADKLVEAVNGQVHGWNMIGEEEMF